MRQYGIFMQVFYSDKPGISFHDGFFMNMNSGFFEKPEIVLFSVAENYADDTSAFLAHHYQRFHCMMLLFA